MRPKKARITMKSSINLMESYHNQLKTFYLGHSRSLCVDRLVYVLSQVVALGYWQDAIKSAHDSGGFRLTANEEKKEEQHIVLITTLPVPLSNSSKEMFTSTDPSLKASSSMRWMSRKIF